jgi:hypothetical protein
MHNVADLRTGIQQRSEGAFTSGEEPVELGRPGEHRPPAGHPLARTVHEPGQEPFPPAHRDGGTAGGRQHLARARPRQLPQSVEPAQQHRKKPVAGDRPGCRALAIA